MLTPREATEAPTQRSRSPFSPTEVTELATVRLFLILSALLCSLRPGFCIVCDFAHARPIMLQHSTSYKGLVSSCHVVWFPDPSVMRMRGRGKTGLGNNYTLARARGWNLKKVLEFISSRCNTNFCPQVFATCTICLPACQYS